LKKEEIVPLSRPLPRPTVEDVNLSQSRVDEPILDPHSVLKKYTNNNSDFVENYYSFKEAGIKIKNKKFFFRFFIEKNKKLLP
jgi:hypothetical protein